MTSHVRSSVRPSRPVRCFGAALLLSALVAASASEASAQPTITVLDATYGERCGVSRGNATWSVAPTCNGFQSCTYNISVGTLGDPKRGCEKDFVVRYKCSNSTASLNAVAPAEANGRNVSLSCNSMVTPRGTITVQHATYGRRCGVAQGTHTWDVSGYCDGFGLCRYRVDKHWIGDPKVGCEKDFDVTYTCSHDGQQRQAHISHEANRKETTLICQ